MFRQFRAWAVIAITAALVCLGGFAARGFSDNGLRLGSEPVWRFTCLIYFAAIVARPLARLIPWRRFGGFANSAARWCGASAPASVFIWPACWCRTHSPVPDFEHDGLTAGMTIFVVFGAALTLVIAYTASRRAGVFLGERQRVPCWAWAWPFLADLCPGGPVAHFRPASSRCILRIQPQPDGDRAAAALRGSLCGENRNRAGPMREPA